MTQQIPTTLVETTLVALPAAYYGIPLPAIPEVPRGAQELYDMLMAEIEPELSTRMLPLLNQLYQTESAEDAQLRAQRYSAAFEQYERRLDSYLVDLTRMMATYEKQARRALEQGDQQAERTALDEQLAEIETSAGPAISLPFTTAL